MPTLIEIKAHCPDHTPIRTILEQHQADFKGIDHQIDTYFKVHHGRLKLREGTIENHLIHYFRKNQAGPKQSNVLLYKSDPTKNLKALLVAANGILAIVDKKRAIYFIENVKFHLDEVQGLGTFIEIEAIDEDGSIPVEELNRQCQHYLNLLAIPQKNLVEVSYSDMLLEKQSVKTT